jgi:iron complex outermembrane recepter protein
MQRSLFISLLILTGISVCAQPQYSPNNRGKIVLKVVSVQQNSLAHATVELLRSTDSVLIKTAITDTTGTTLFDNLPAGDYICRVSMVNYASQISPVVHINDQEFQPAVAPMVLSSQSALLSTVTVEARKPFIQQFPDKIVVNVDASITNAGTTALEVLEKSPGVTVDRNGSISLKGKQGVTIMIDNKPSYVSGSDLVNLLSSMSSSQLEQIEIMDNPSAKYDAAGNAGIINIKTKKNRQKGFNGTLNVAYGQGVYPKNNNSLVLNYRTGAINLFLTYSSNISSFFTEMYALRSYFKADGKTITAQLEQPYYNKGTGYSNSIRTGLDYFVSKKTTLGIILTGVAFHRDFGGTSNAQWINTTGGIDSVIHTVSSNVNHWKNGGVNFNLRHSFDKNRELTADVDYLDYDFSTDQYFENTLTGPGGYQEALSGYLPSRIHILSGKADYSQQLTTTLKFETGWKSSHVTTDNNALYQNRVNGIWEDDLGKTNHFMYAESIHAGYVNIEKQSDRLTLQGGLRYEYTGYQADQLGNAIRKDSSFSRNYNSLFPTAFVTYKADSLNSFTISAGRRIDRPSFNKLNPFVFVINKYTSQTGNPYFRPQYTWNLELSHLFKEMLTTSISYSTTKDYISQIFLTDSVNGTILYTEGNMGHMENVGFSVSAQVSPTNWWSFSADATFNHKKIKGVIWKNYRSSINQLEATINNQFHFKKGWSGELSGTYITRNQNDIQEILDPTGQVSAGIAKLILKNKGTLKFTVRDIFFTQAMQGLTDFQQSNEFFRLTRDSRVATLAFTWRFGKPLKSAARRSGGSAGDEIQRVSGG